MLLSLFVAMQPASAQEAWTQLAPTAFTPVVPLPAEVSQALIDRDHAAAAEGLLRIPLNSVPGPLVGDLAFLTAWSLQRANRGTEAARFLDAAAHAENAPMAYVQLVIGESLIDQGKPIEAAAALSTALGGGPLETRARLALAEAYQKAERTADAKAVYEALILRPDPAPGSSTALWKLANKVGLSSPEGQGLLRRLYRYYPGSAEDLAASSHRPSPTLEDLAIRGDNLQERTEYAAAADLLDNRIGEVGTKDAVGCRYRYAYGRAQQKLSNFSKAIEVLAPIGRNCAGIDDERGAKALYLAGKSYERKKDWASAAANYALIPTAYPNSSYADDGYTLGGIARQEAGDLPGARALWSTGFEAYPHGDLAGETTWRLAWGAFLGGDTADAIHWADRAVAEVPITSGGIDVIGAAYWAGRWRVWPSRDDPKARVSDPAVVQIATDSFARIGIQHPGNYYAVLAMARLAELAPARARGIDRPPFDSDDAPWQVAPAFLNQPAVRNAQGLARIGLLRDALVELDTLDEATLGGAEMAIITGIQAAAGDVLYAHDRLRSWLKTHPPATLGPNTYKVLRRAFPEMWWPEVQEAASGYTWDARVFHALVREESNFNPDIRSFAGACGLSQLMPGTASGCAKRMGLSFSSRDIWKPTTNLKIGAYYLDSLHETYGGNSALALAAYNAGPGNTNLWLSQHPEWPTDAMVEAIPFRETRFYVKRVLSTWQTYRLLYGSGPLFEDWTRFADDAVPAR